MTLLKNDKYEIKCRKGDAETVEIEIIIKDDKLKEEDVNDLLTTLRKLLYAFDRTESVSSRYGSANGKRK